MPDISAMGIDPEDIVRFVIADFAPNLPAYNDRLMEYAAQLQRGPVKPDVMLIQGVKENAVSVVSTMFSHCSWHVSPNRTYHGYLNMTGVSRDFTLLDRSEIRMAGDHNPLDDIESPNDVLFCPDCLVDTFEVNGNKVRVYNYEAMRGPLFEVQRVYCASLITRDAYRYLQSRNGAEVLMYLGGDLHADADFESVRLLTGKMTRKGVYPSAFTDVWPVMHKNSNDKGYTERETDVFDSTVKLPKLIQPHRHTYFMVYGDAFGRIGTPLAIEINGNNVTDSMIPLSDDYGLTMDVWIPPEHEYISSE